MSHEEAVAALTLAAQQDAGEAPVEQAPAPTPVAAPEGVVPPAAPAVPEGEPEAAPEFFNPDTLDPALLPGWKQLQGAFTQKTQELAAQRAALDQYGDEETLSEAIELYERISDPSNWAQLAEELSEAMQEQGMSPAAANALAREEVQLQAAAPSPLDGIDLTDPDMAPLVASIRQQQERSDRLEQQLQSFQAQQQEEQEYQQADREQQEYAFGIQKQLHAIAQSNPSYDETDLKSIVKLAPFYNDDYFQAQAEYENIVASRLDRYFAGKQGSLLPSLAPTPGAGATSTPVRPEQTLREIEAEVIAQFEAMQANGEFD